MKKSLKKLLTFKLKDSENNFIGIKDILFDEESWVVRYLEVDFQNPFDNKILLSSKLISKAEWDIGVFNLKVNSEKISKAPALIKELRVSRKYEEALNKYYELPKYWDIELKTDKNTSLFPQRPFKVPTTHLNELDTEFMLRSYIETIGHLVKTKDAEIGNITDFIIDEYDWQLVYAIVDTEYNKPMSKKLIVPIELFDKISHAKGQIDTALNSSIFENAPVYNSERPINQEFEVMLYDYYIEKMEEKLVQ